MRCFLGGHSPRDFLPNPLDEREEHGGRPHHPGVLRRGLQPRQASMTVATLLWLQPGFGKWLDTAMLGLIFAVEKGLGTIIVCEDT